jgi:hypothetical protein
MHSEALFSSDGGKGHKTGVLLVSFRNHRLAGNGVLAGGEGSWVMERGPLYIKLPTQSHLD